MREGVRAPAGRERGRQATTIHTPEIHLGSEGCLVPGFISTSNYHTETTKYLGLSCTYSGLPAHQQSPGPQSPRSLCGQKHKHLHNPYRNPDAVFCQVERELVGLLVRDDVAPPPLFLLEHQQPSNTLARPITRLWTSGYQMVGNKRDARDGKRHAQRATMHAPPTLPIQPSTCKTRSHMTQYKVPRFRPALRCSSHLTERGGVRLQSILFPLHVFTVLPFVQVFAA